MSQQLQHHQCLTVSTLGATSAAQTSGEKASCSHETRIRLRKLQRSENVSVYLNHHETCARLPSQPSPYCCSPSLTVGAKMFGNRGANTDTSQDNTLCGRALPHAFSLKTAPPFSQTQLEKLELLHNTMQEMSRNTPKNDDLFNHPNFNLRHGKHHSHQLFFQQWHGNSEKPLLGALHDVLLNHTLGDNLEDKLLYYLQKRKVSECSKFRCPILS